MVLTIGIGGLAIYLVVGAFLLVPIHLRALPLIDPACTGTPLVFRVLISPGLITFWPIVLLRWRRAIRCEDTAGPLDRPLSPSGLQNVHFFAVLSLALLAPLFMILTLSIRGENPVYNDLPGESQLEAAWLQRGFSYGRIFPSVAADVYLARNTGRHMGLLFEFSDDATTQPVAIYWAKEWNPNEILPHDAVFLGMVSGPRNTWIQFTDHAMSSNGYWIAYSFLTHETELYPSPWQTR